MKKLNMIIVMAIGAVGLCAFMASAQPSISGPQSGTLGPGTYIVDGGISVSAGQTLTIAPGTTFLHTGSFSWVISGELHAVGTLSQPIQFLAQDPVEDHLWGGLRFLPGHSSNSLLEWCEISHCQGSDDSLNIYYYGSAAYLSGGGLTLRQCTISNCEAGYGGGFEIVNASDIEIDHCTIENCVSLTGGGGLHVTSSNNVLITNCVIKNNSSTST
jgi:hypothetical protein